MTTADVVLYFAIFALISVVGVAVMNRRARKERENDPIARQLRAFSDEFNQGR